MACTSARARRAHRSALTPSAPRAPWKSQVELSQNAIPTMWAAPKSDEKYTVQLLSFKWIKDLNYKCVCAPSAICRARLALLPACAPAR